MFGNNPVRPTEHELSGASLRVQEIFATIQGEGPHAGIPAIFIRLAGCNLRCHFCDTDFESNYHRTLTVPQILMQVFELVKSCNIRLAVITGGEPLLQNIIPLLNELTRNFFKVQIETAGTVWLNGLDAWSTDPNFLVCSPKTAKLHYKILKHCKCWKYVVQAGKIDSFGLPNGHSQIKDRGARIARPSEFTIPERIYLQPCDEGDPFKNRQNMEAAVQACMRHGYRLCLQQHKIVGLE